MTNFQIEFTNPWLLLLLIPALFFALFPYFRLSKRYRRTRNRIISVVLHSLIMVLAVTLLAGIGFTYEIPNTDNEILLLVDVSHSSRESQEQKDELVRSAIDGKSSTMKMGIVTFGYDQVYAAPLSYDADGLYDQYLAAELPDTSATDFEAALRFAAGLFEHPESAKIVVISDGDETDGDALAVGAIDTLTSEGIKVDTAFIPNENTNDEVRIAGITYPETSIKAGEPFELVLNLQSSYRGVARFTMTDNGTAGEEQIVELTGGEQTIRLEHTFALPGLHTVGFTIESDRDTLTENNLYNSYYYLEVYDDILIVEREAGDSAQFTQLLTTAEYQPVVVGIGDSALPLTVEDLQDYDEVVLFNISYSDMATRPGFEEALYTYVHDIGGSLLTVGGNKVEGNEEVANIYDPDDMHKSTYYGNMLPVETTNYTPPLGVVIIIDRSGSMSGGPLEAAKDGAVQSLSALDYRDYVGVMTLEDSYDETVPLRPMTDESSIRSAIYDIPDDGGGTQFLGAIRTAANSLNMLSQVQKRHIILITDANPGDPAYTDTAAQTGGWAGEIRSNYYENGITCSMICVTSSGGSGSASSVMEELSLEGIGTYAEVSTSQMSDLNEILRDDLLADAITEYVPEEFTPRIDDLTIVVEGIAQADMPSLGGYYGTRLKAGAVQPLVTPYNDAPVYAQWNYGAGKVGSFMSDLYGTEGSWSYDFMQSETGILLLNNIVMSLYPTRNFHNQDILVELTEKNYTTKVSIGTTLQEGETVEISVMGPTGENGQAEVQIVQPTAADRFSSASFVARQPGLYTVVVEKKDAAGNVIASATTYRTFSYSAEYNEFADEEACAGFMDQLSVSGGGASIADVRDIFENLVRTLARSFDPRILFAILIIVMFLLDVAVRKFKFKWPHEIIRDHKEKKKLMQDNKAAQQLRSDK